MDHQPRICQYKNCPSPLRELPKIGHRRKNGDIFFDSPNRKYHLKCRNEIKKLKEAATELKRLQDKYCLRFD